MALVSQSDAEFLPCGIPRAAWFLTGPTAAGKTSVAIELAKRLAADILSLDSMALYRRLDIGTAKPSPVEQAAIRHRLIDLLEPHQDYSLADYLAAARSAAEEAVAQQRAVLFAGGTPLYLKALLRGFFVGPPADWSLRRDWEQRAAQQPPGWLHAQLAEIDPPAAAKLHPNDARRVIRALEVIAKTGRRMSDWQQQFNRPQPQSGCRVFVLDWPRDQLYRRINARVEAMFAAGLVAEVASLRASGVTLGRTARQALGYREVLEHLDGQRDLTATVELIRNRTRAFARRQLTWFRSLAECRWIKMDEGDSTAKIAEVIVNSA